MRYLIPAGISDCVIHPQFYSGDAGRERMDSLKEVIIMMKDKGGSFMLMEDVAEGLMSGSVQTDPDSGTVPAASAGKKDASDATDASCRVIFHAIDGCGAGPHVEDSRDSEGSCAGDAGHRHIFPDEFGIPGADIRGRFRFQEGRQEYTDGP